LASSLQPAAGGGFLRRRLPGAAALLLAVLAVGCSDDPAPPDAGAKKAVVAHLESQKGAVTLERDGVSGPAQLGYLYAADAVETGPSGSARVRLSGGRVVEIGPDARFELREGEGGVLLELARGLLLTRVEGGGAMGDSKMAFTVLTPFGLTRVGAGGSELSIDVGKDGAQVEVKLGAVELVSRNGEVTRAGQGDKLKLGAQKVAEPTGDLVLPPLEVVIIQATGRAELKKKDGKSWAPVSGRKPTPIAEGDQVRVQAGQVVLQPKDSGTRLSLLSGATATLAKASRGEGTEALSLELAQGQAEAVMPASQRTRLGFGPLTVVAQRGGKTQVDKTARGYTVRALAGAVTLERAGQSAVEVPGGSVATLEGDAVEVAAPSREPLVLPSRPGLRVYQSQASPLALTWEGDEGKDYRVELATDPNFKNLLLAGEVRARHLNVTSPARGSLYWRVFDGEKALDRGSASFGPEPKSGELDRNKNEVPEGSEKTSIYFQDKPPVVTFTWKAEEGAARYLVRVYREGDLSKTVSEREGATTAIALAEPLSEGNYLWSVTPLGKKGEELRGGKMNKLEIVYDNAVQGLVIKSPRNGDPGGKDVNVAGIAPLGAKVWVNGRPLAVDSANRFSGTASPLARGVLVFRMQLGAAEQYTVRRLKVR
jgi:FecR protein